MTTSNDEFIARLVSRRSKFVVVLQSENNELPSILFSFLEPDASGNIAYNQIKTSEMVLRARDVIKILQNYASIGKRIYAIIDFLNSLDEGEAFLFSANETGEFDNETAFFAVLALNNNEDEIDLMKEIKSILSNLHDKYNVFPITPDMSIDRITLGEYQKDKRKCIFCGKTQSEGAVFRNKSHAISESLGNKAIIHLEECDMCNEVFGRTFEVDIANFFLPDRIFHQISGSNGVPSAILTNGAKIISGENGYKLVQWPEHITIEPGPSNQLRVETTTSYTPSGIYRSIVKYAFSGMPKEFLPSSRFKIFNWLMMDIKLERLPKVLFAEFDAYPPGMAPYFILYTLKEIDPMLPKVVIEFHFLNKMYIAAIEMEMSNDNIDEINASMDNFLELYPIQKISPSHKWIDLSSEKSKPVAFEIPYKNVSLLQTSIQPNKPLQC